MTLHDLKRVLSSRSRSFSPFFVLGDPTPEISVELCVAAVEAGASMLELGLPFSDPVADGVEIAAAGERAARAGTGTERALECLARVAERVDVPLNLLVYANLIHARGAAAFCRDAARAGASSILCPEVPLEESDGLREACADNDVGFVQLVGPNTPPSRLEALDASATAFLYLVSHQGITGGRADTTRVADLVRRVTGSTSTPVCVGFGLSEPAHLSSVFDAGANIAIVGSALARLIRLGVEAGTDASSLIAEIQEACRKLATQPAIKSC